MKSTDTKRSGTRGASSFACEALEPRRMMVGTTTAQVLIMPRIAEVSATFTRNLGVDIHLHDVTGTMTLIGDNLAEQSSGDRINVTGTVSSIQSLALSNTTRNSSIIFRTTGSAAVDISRFTSTGPMGLIELPAIGPGAWNISGAVNRLIAGSTDPAWTANIATINHLDIPGTAAGSLTSDDINTFTAGVMSGMTLDFPSLPTSRGTVLNSLQANEIVNSHIFSQNSMGSIRTDGFTDSSIFAGVIGTTALPTQASSFLDGVTIDRLSIGGKKDSTGFRNSLLAVPVVGQTNLVPLLLSSQPEIATEKIKNLTVLPFLESIPLVGHLFRAHDVTQENELIILVRPTIILPAE